MKKLLWLLLLGTAWAQCPSPAPPSPVVCLTWVASTTTGVKYNIYRGTTPGGESATALNPTPLTTLYLYDSAVVRGTTYYYTAKAVDSSGNLSTATNEAQAVIPLQGNGVTPAKTCYTIPCKAN